MYNYSGLMNLTEKINCKEEYTGELVNSKAVMG